MPDPSVLLGLLTLILLEIVLGIDNLIFISLLTDRLPQHQRRLAWRIGLALALVARLALLAGLMWLIGLTAPLFEIAGEPFSARDLIMVGGGLFLIYSATTEIRRRVEGESHDRPAATPAGGMAGAIAQIVAIDLVFSVDSVLTAIGMVRELWVMVVAVFVAIGTMFVAAGPVTGFVNRHPSVKMLALSFLLLVGMVLVADGFGVHVPKGYVYGAVAFSLLVETLNLLAARRSAAR
jgi:predicted tellurium resistance membrane protein TerC